MKLNSPALNCDYQDKPPFLPKGLKPKYIHDAERRLEITDAITRYILRHKPIPIEWIEEYNGLCEEG